MTPDPKDYPRMLYRRGDREIWVIVNSEKQEVALGAEWSRTISTAALPPEEKRQKIPEPEEEFEVELEPEPGDLPPVYDDAPAKRKRPAPARRSAMRHRRNSI